MRWPLLRLLRPEQWIKNLLVLAPWVFAGLGYDLERGQRALAAALLFTAASALVYVFNDYADLDRDRAHAIKRRTRPLAAGLVTPLTALSIGAILVVLILAGAVTLPAVASPVFVFVALNLLYSALLKHMPVVELLSVAAGYLIRVYAGAQAVNVPLSGWMAMATLFLSLFLVSSKRYAELTSGDVAGRRVLVSYSPRFLNFFHWATGIVTFGFYVAYVALVQPALLPTIPVVALGLLRYARLTTSAVRTETPSEVLWGDVPLLATVVVWGLLSWLLIPPG